jgi:LCP family protein required for cell wall assembly
LSRCPACKAYSERPDDAAILLALLDVSPFDAAPEPQRASPVAPLKRAPGERPVPRPAPLRPARRRRAPAWLRYSLIGGLALFLLGLAVGIGRLAMAAYTIGDNLQAMQVTAAPTLEPTPALLVPTGPPVPTLTPQPAAGVLDAPPAAPTAEPDRGAAEEVAAAPSAAPSTTGETVASPVRLPPIGGPAPLPTLMPTMGVLSSVAEGQPVNILLLGSDRRPGEGWQTRSDAIVVVRLEPATQRVAMLSLPRDLIVAIPGYGQARINAATVYGELNPELGGGVELARQTVSQLLGISIDHVVRADFSAFTQAVDAIGGIDLYVEKELYDAAYPTMDYGYMEVYFPVGPMQMDGETALIYSRVRHMDSNYARNRRQQEVLVAILQRVREQNVLGQVQMLADLSTALRDNVQTDLSLDQMIGLAWAFRSVAPEQVERYALDENLVYEGGIPGDPYATLPAAGAINSLVGQLMGQ